MSKAPPLLRVVRTVVALLIALSIALLIILAVSERPGEAIGAFLVGPLTSVRRFGNVIEAMIPLICTGLATSVMFCAAQFNLASEGAFFFGAIGAAAIAVSGPLPGFIHPLFAIITGGLLGAVFCGIPGMIKARWGASELVSSLMLNHIAFFLGIFMINYFMRDTSAGAMVSYPFLESARLPAIIPGTRVSMGLIVAALLVVFGAVLVFRTPWGYRIRVVGANIAFARYVGIDVGKTIVLSQVIGGILAGVGGAVEVLGLYRRFAWQLLPGYGWDGIIIAILCGNNPALVPLGAFFLAYLRTGADIMSRTSDVANEFVAFIQGTMIVFIAAEGFMQFRSRQTAARTSIAETEA